MTGAMPAGPAYDAGAASVTTNAPERRLVTSSHRPSVPRAATVATVIAAAGCAVPFLGASTLTLTLLTQAVISALLASGVGLLVRQNGLVSFGHALFFGLAAYGVALAGTSGLVSTETAIVLSLVGTALVAFVVGLVFLRLIGVAFSMMTLAMAQGVHEVFLRLREFANGEDGMRIDLPDHLFGLDVDLFRRAATMFPIVWVALTLVVFGLWLLARSHFGTLTVAIRENEERVRFLGYRTDLPRALIFALSASIAALAGVFFALYNGFVTPEALHWSLSGEILIMAIIGGTRRVWGPALGAVLFFFLKGALGDVTEHWQAIMGSVLIVVVVLLPDGISGLPAAILRRFGRRTA